MALPEVVDMKLPVEACFHNLAIVSIKKRYPGHAAKVMHALWGLGQMMFCKCIVVVDHDVNVQTSAKCCGASPTTSTPVATSSSRTVPWTSSTMRRRGRCVGSKMGIDATAKWRDEGYDRDWPPTIEMSTAVRRAGRRAVAGARHPAAPAVLGIGERRSR